MSGETEMTVTLNWTMWELVLRHLYAGTFQDVQAVVASLVNQISPQIETAQRIVAANIEDINRRIAEQAAPQADEPIVPVTTLN